MYVKLIASGGIITVARRTANYTYGAWSVTYPESTEDNEVITPDEDYRISPGYIHKLRAEDEERIGLFGRLFTKADANINIPEGESNLERILQSSERRSEGGVFFQRNITGAGLGEYQPGIDFNVGDIVDVEIYNKTIPLPVTAIDKATTVTDHQSATVMVGGALINDAQALSSKTSQVEKAIKADRRKALQEFGRVTTEINSARHKAEQAQETANTAQQAADTVSTRVESVKEQMDNLKDTTTTRLQDLSNAQEVLEEARVKLINSKTLQGKITLDMSRSGDQQFINENQQAWNSLQVEFNEETNQYMADTKALIKSLQDTDEALKSADQSIIATVDSITSDFKELRQDIINLEMSFFNKDRYEWHYPILIRGNTIFETINEDVIPGYRIEYGSNGTSGRPKTITLTETGNGGKLDLMIEATDSSGRTTTDIVTVPNGQVPSSLNLYYNSHPSTKVTTIGFNNYESVKILFRISRMRKAAPITRRNNYSSRHQLPRNTWHDIPGMSLTLPGKARDAIVEIEVENSFVTTALTRQYRLVINDRSYSYIGQSNWATSSIVGKPVTDRRRVRVKLPDLFFNESDYDIQLQMTTDALLWQQRRLDGAYMKIEYNEPVLLPR